MVNIELINSDKLKTMLNGLCELVVDAVENGASIGFLSPLSMSQVAPYWLDDVSPMLQSGATQLFVAREGKAVLGCVQLQFVSAANQPHRCEIAKLIVHTKARRRGIAKKLMNDALSAATAANMKLVTLDTRSGDPSQYLYEGLGFSIAGQIPMYAQDPQGDRLSATTYMYKLL